MGERWYLTKLAFLWRLWSVQQLSGAAAVILKKCGRSRIQGDQLWWSFYRKIDSWFLWLLIEIPTNSNRFHTLFFGNRLGLPSWSLKYHSVPFFWCRFWSDSRFRTAENRRLQIAPIRPQGAILNRTCVKPVGVCGILLMEAIVYQLRLVVYPTIYKVLYFPRGCLGFLNHQQYITSFFDLWDVDRFSILVAFVYFVRCHGWPLCCQSFLEVSFRGRRKSRFSWPFYTGGFGRARDAFAKVGLGVKAKGIWRWWLGFEKSTAALKICILCIYIYTLQETHIAPWQLVRWFSSSIGRIRYLKKRNPSILGTWSSISDRSPRGPP